VVLIRNNDASIVVVAREELLLLVVVVISFFLSFFSSVFYVCICMYISRGVRCALAFLFFKFLRGGARRSRFVSLKSWFRV